MTAADRLQAILLSAIAAASVIICFFIDPAAGFTAAAAFLLCAGILIIFAEKQQKQIRRLCEETARILRGAEQIDFDSFNEGSLSILASEIRKMTVKLREQNTALQEDKVFLKESLEDISHQLRTPLTSTLLLLEILRKPDLTRAQKSEALQELFSLLSRMQWLIETLLSLSRLEAGAAIMQHSEIRCSELIAAAMEPLSIAMDLKNIRTEIRTEGEPALTGNRPYLTEALGNILKNCLEHTPEGGSITVTASENAIYTGICITDTGNGIAKEDLPHIFERFYRGSDFARNGYGIGLAYANKIVRQQNGTLSVRNADPRGAQFELRIYKTAV